MTEQVNSPKRARKLADRSYKLARRMAESIRDGQSLDRIDLIDAICFRRESLEKMHPLYAAEFEELLFKLEQMLPEAKVLWVRNQPAFWA